MIEPIDRFIHSVLSHVTAKLQGALTCELGTTGDGGTLHGVLVPNTPERTVVLGYPHPAEPLAQIAWDSINATVEQRQKLGGDGCWLIIPVWDMAGARLAESAWQNEHSTIGALAKSWVRPAPNLQVEWSFPVECDGQRWEKALPETRAVQALLEDLEPHYLFSLHNAVFPDAYALVSDDLGHRAMKFRDALKQEGMGCREPSPIPYVPTFGPGVYGLPGIRREWQYLLSVASDSHPVLTHGAASFDVCTTSTSCVLELPLFSWRVLRMPSDELIALLSEAEARCWGQLGDMCDRLLPADVSTNDDASAYLLSSPRYLHEAARAGGVSPLTVQEGRSLPSTRELVTRLCTSIFTAASNISMLQRGLGSSVEYPENVREALATVDQLFVWRDAGSLTRCLSKCLAVTLLGFQNDTSGH